MPCKNCWMSKIINAITVSEIAQTAGMGKGSIYYYFSSKEAILEALVERTYEAFGDCDHAGGSAGYFPVYPYGNDLSGVQELIVRIFKARSIAVRCPRKVRIFIINFSII